MKDTIAWVICAPPYNPDSGGSICLHALADVLCGLGLDACLAPIQVDEMCSPFDLRALSKSWRRRLFSGHKTITTSLGNRAACISAYKARQLAKDGAIFIYPELVLGNPYQARRVVRWLLHFPMHFRKTALWHAGDLIVRFNDAVPVQQLSGTNFLENSLKIVQYPWRIYQDAAAPASQRKGNAYLVRKGKNKPFIHSADAICVDDLSHTETARILGQCKTFYSYDPYTAYSLLAVVAGCQSIVVPDEGVSLERWYPDPADRYGLSYGSTVSPESELTAPRVLERLQQAEASNIKVAADFVHEVSQYLT